MSYIIARVRLEGTRHRLAHLKEWLAEEQECVERRTNDVRTAQNHLETRGGTERPSPA